MCGWYVFLASILLYYPVHVLCDPRMTTKNVMSVYM